MQSRIDPTGIVATLPRQTPRNDFGEVLTRTVNGAVRLGGAIAGSVNGMPVLSAAVSAVSALATAGAGTPAQTASTVAQPAIPVASVPGGASAGRGLSGLAGTGPDNYGNGLVDSMHQSSMQSLYLQVAMQQESREYNAISNVLKVRHDSAKAAINNIR